MHREIILRRVRWLTWLFILGLVISGVTAIPLRDEAGLLIKWSGAENDSTGYHGWLNRIYEALQQTHDEHSFLFYGTDWLAFGHFVIAIAFIGAIRDPLRNRWLFDFGLIACLLLVPYALIFGGVRGIPIWWRLIDCSFGVIAFIPLWFCRKWMRELEEGIGTRPLR